jgi:hypothetical protein
VNRKRVELPKKIKYLDYHLISATVLHFDHEQLPIKYANGCDCRRPVKNRVKTRPFEVYITFYHT